MTDRKLLPDVSILSSLFDYNPDNGDLIRKITSSSNAKAGDIIRGFCKKGYRRVRIFGENHYAHRIAWKMFYGEDPPQFLDHINRDKSDNRISNMREATASLNGLNRKVQSNNKTGFPGIIKSRDKWVACIKVDGINKNLGSFVKKEDAIKARINAEKIYCDN